MYTRTDSVMARLTVVTTLFLLSACVISRTNDSEAAGTKDDDKPTAADAAQAKSEAQMDAAVPGKATADAAPAPKSTTPGPLKRSARLSNTKAKATVAKSSTKDEERVIRYVTAEILNVRSAPRPDAPIIGRLARGSMFTVTALGDWAKLADGEYVLAKFLSRTQPSVRERLAARGN